MNASRLLYYSVLQCSVICERKWMTEQNVIKQFNAIDFPIIYAMKWHFLWSIVSHSEMYYLLLSLMPFYEFLPAISMLIIMFDVKIVNKLYCLCPAQLFCLSRIRWYNLSVCTVHSTLILIIVYLFYFI